MIHTYRIFLFLGLLLGGSLVQAQVLFYPNHGQVRDSEGRPDPGILYVAQFPGMNLFIREKGFSYVLAVHPEIPSDPDQQATARALPSRFHRVDVDFVGTQVSDFTSMVGPGQHVKRYYQGQDGAQCIQVAGYPQINYLDVYPGISIAFYSRGNALEYDIQLAADADPRQVQVRVTGADALELTPSGLQFHTSLGTITETLPAVYQLRDGKREALSCAYELVENRISYAVEGRDPNLPMVIDPLSSWATFMGGSGADYGRGVAQNGTVYMCGETQSADFPVSVGASQSAHGGGRDAFLTAFSNTGIRLWTTYFGSTGSDVAEDVAVDALGNIAMTGHCTGAIPVTAGCYQSAHAGGGFDGFLAQFDPSGALNWATHLGGEDDDHSMDLAIDASNNITIGGYTRSSFQISTGGVVQAARTGGFDSMIMQFNAAGGRNWGTYWGGTSTEYGRGIDVDASGNVILVGETYSTNYPTGASAGNSVFQAANAGGVQDMYAVKLNSTGSTRLWSTYIGGATGTDRGFCVSVDALDNVYVAGNSFGGFPVTAGVVQTIYGTGMGDGAVIKLAPTGSRMWASYLGGSQYDLIMSVDAVGSSSVVFGGETQSAWVNVNNCTVSCGGSSNFCGFITHLNANGTTRIMSSIIGGASSFNSVLDVSATTTGEIFLTGFSNATTYPVGGTHVFQNVYGGGSVDAILGTYNASVCWNVVLDAEFEAVSGEWQDPVAVLHWTANEKQSTRSYLVQRSFDGRNFGLAGEVVALRVEGNVEYTFRDAGSALGGQSQLWYRVLQVDVDGSVQFSDVVELSPDPGFIAPRIYPNPSTGKFRVAVPDGVDVLGYAIFSVDGRQVTNRPNDGIPDGKELNLEALAAGLYVMEFRLRDGLHRMYLVVQR